MVYCDFYVILFLFGTVLLIINFPPDKCYAVAGLLILKCSAFKQKLNVSDYPSDRILFFLSMRHGLPHHLFFYFLLRDVIILVAAVRRTGCGYTTSHGSSPRFFALTTT